ncbi:MAG TPA: PLDc N-terminal domain-containing protein [bacterium]|nr:PLDc N-terminal domain-containing protein [bacterium]
MYGLAAILVFVLDIIAIVDCVQSSMDSVKKLLWVLLILALPVFGMVLYFLLAKKNVSV